MAGRIKDSTVEAVRQSADFVAIVEERTPLRKAGARLVGRCPFHDERTPSFSVNAVDKLFYCHGCHKGGDMIAFVRETQGLTFVEAIEWIAGRSGITPEYEESSPEDDLRRSRRERMLSLLDTAASFYERYLWESQAGSFARDYLAGRGLGEEICREFRLGLAIGGTTLTRKALEKGFSVDELRAVGLTRARGGDYFERRLVFPLSDARGRILGFQARRLHDDDPLQAKYVNTAESELFKKGDVVYGLNLARLDISQADRACVVEGNTDVIALRQAGFKPVVACMGTALTEHQLRELKRLTNRLWLAFDGDAAGESAALRGMELAVRQGFEVKIVALPPGIDPADDPAGFEARLGSAKPYVRYRAEIEAQRADDKEAARRAVQDFLNSVPDSVDRRETWRWANDYFGMPIQIRGAGTAAVSVAPSPRLEAAGDRLERGALAAVVSHKSLTVILAEIPPEHFRSETHRALRDHLVHGTAASDEVLALKAELDALAVQEGIDTKAAGEEFLLRLSEREVWAELRQADSRRSPELREKLNRIQGAIANLEKESVTPG